jgi:hypothetical protein
VVVPAANGEGWSGFEEIMDHANAVLAAMVEERTITVNERKAMVLGGSPRTKQELLEPFADGRFRGLAVEHCEIAELEDPAWEDYQRSGDRVALAGPMPRTTSKQTHPSLVFCTFNAATCAAEMPSSASP